MKVKLYVSRSGPNGAFAAGDEIDVDDAEGHRMIAKGQCAPVREAKPEKAIKRTKSEKASK